MGLQETMSHDDTHYLIQSLWKSNTFGHYTKKADGKSGGIIAIWDPNYFSSTTSMDGDGFVAIIGNWIDLDENCLLIVVYTTDHVLIGLIDLDENCLLIVIGNGCDTRFWSDNWLGGSPLKVDFPRLFRLDSNPHCLVCDRSPTFHPLASTQVVPDNHVTDIGPSRHTGLEFHWAWRRPIRSVPEFDELTSLCLDFPSFATQHQELGSMQKGVRYEKVYQV
ncbi:hypothetical protein CTI12_AA434360 [Artemisia annua]|uniref:Uncharacterized protein n=1 Tax=Artemisia annua TaxID=35608 RepID=A0A2U1LLF6_ARTAN|nr:hypothetical protein CTI12_AA434360 [Artemisia annua]